MSARILVVDDEAEILEMIRLMFRNEHVRTAQEVPVALELLKAESFDVLISDVRMPGTSGLTLIQEARSLRPEIGVIVITGHQQEENLPGVVRWILKPFRARELQEAVAAALPRGRRSP
jgi:two-component system response regulator YesN